MAVRAGIPPDGGQLPPADSVLAFCRRYRLHRRRDFFMWGVAVQPRHLAPVCAGRQCLPFLRHRFPRVTGVIMRWRTRVLKPLVSRGWGLPPQTPPEARKQKPADQKDGRTPETRG